MTMRRGLFSSAGVKAYLKACCVASFFSLHSSGGAFDLFHGPARLGQRVRESISAYGCIELTVVTILEQLRRRIPCDARLPQGHVEGLTTQVGMRRRAENFRPFSLRLPPLFRRQLFRQPFVRPLGPHIRQTVGIVNVVRVVGLSQSASR